MYILILRPHFLQSSRTDYKSHLLPTLYSFIFSLIILHNVQRVSSNRLLNTNCVASVKGTALAKHSYISLVTDNMLACYYRCKGDNLCQSINFYEKSNICELNNRTRAVGHLNFLPNAGAVYLDNPFRGKLLILQIFILPFYKFHI